ncbi:MAG TPA: metallophosphoesterase family protein [Flavitalea sp.]|nr:metallophosphoesterase family protein [Flavitalea sp.]
MTRIGLLSDTHNFLDDAVFRHFEQCDEIWHAGDFGNVNLAENLASFRPLKGVYGNIDGYDVRSVYPELLRWKCEEVEVMMCHIGGYPGKYTPIVKAEMKQSPPQLFISGHSHILKIIYDKEYDCLHINPGAAGREGWHKTRTLVLFNIQQKNIKDCRIVELGKR